MNSFKTIFDFLFGGLAMVGLIICISELCFGHKKPRMK
jgi:hypothetical protein